MNSTPQREFWTGQPVELETMWILSKSGKAARLVLLTHKLGWELRVESGDLLLTQVCRSDRDIEDVSAAWKAAMIESSARCSGPTPARTPPPMSVRAS